MIMIFTRCLKQAVQYQNYTMNDLGPHLRALHFQSLAEENEELRRRVAKLTEIEGYVELLVDKLEKAERREQIVTGENSLLRQQAREMEMKFSQNESMHGDQMRYVFAQHDQLLQEKNRALTHLKAQLDQEQARAAHADTESKNQRLNLQRAVEEYELALNQVAASNKEYQVALGQMRTANKEYQVALSQLRAENKELQGDLQLLYQSHEQERVKFAIERQNWAAQSNRLRAAIQEKNIAVSQLGKQLNELSQALDVAGLQIKKLTDYNQQIEISFQRHQSETSETIKRLGEYNRQSELKFQQRQAESSETIIHMQEGIDVLRLEVERISGECLAVRAAKSAVQHQLEQAKVVQVHLRNDNDTYVTDNQRLIFLLDEADIENSFLREKQRELQEYSTAENDQARAENVRLREEIVVLSKNSSERQTLLGTRLIQLKEALNAKSSLELQMSQAQGQFQVISEEILSLQQAHYSQKQRSTELQLALKNALEDGNKAKIALNSAQTVARRIQQQNSDLAAQNHTLARQISNPREMSKDYREQVDRMVKNFHDQREEQAKRHWLEKEKLREVYEYELKQKQLELARRIAELEEQLLRMKRLQAITARTTPAKLK